MENLLKRLGTMNGFGRPENRIARLFGTKPSDGRHDGPEPADILKGVAAGVIGGLVASWVMNQVHGLAAKGIKTLERSDDRSADAGGRDKSKKNEREERSKSEPATVKAAEAISEGVFGHELSPSEKKTAGPAVHYGYGAFVGGVYGGLAEALPGVTTGAGTAYGAALWLGGDEVAVPALGLAGPPNETPAAVHVDALAAHLVYGLTAEGVRRAVRAAL